nr:hypothetical protein [Tanacetum cinerariifolium]
QYVSDVSCMYFGGVAGVGKRIGDDGPEVGACHGALPQERP